MLSLEHFFVFLLLSVPLYPQLSASPFSPISQEKSKHIFLSFLLRHFLVSLQRSLNESKFSSPILVAAENCFVYRRIWEWNGFLSLHQQQICFPSFSAGNGTGYLGSSRSHWVLPGMCGRRSLAFSTADSFYFNLSFSSSWPDLFLGCGATRDLFLGHRAASDLFCVCVCVCVCFLLPKRELACTSYEGKIENQVMFI